jgi:predicted O-linked N-acetylglucosamine transferase (SPINDLY family)
MATISESLVIAIRHHQAGRVEAAEQIYRQVLQAEPNQADAIHLLGLLAHQAGKHAIAAQYIEQAIRLNGNTAIFHNNLGGAYHALHRNADAVACFRRAVELKPDYAVAYYNLGNAWKDLGKWEEAVACYRRSLELKPNYAEAHNNLGNAYKEQGKLEEAAACCHRALELKPDYAEAHNNLGNARKCQGNLDEAIACYRRALELKPDYAEAHNNLGNAWKDQGQLDDAVACYRRAVELKPDYAVACFNLGNALRDQGTPDEAVACYRRALELKPDFAEAHSNLGNVCKDQGNFDEAITCFRRTLELKLDDAEAHNNLGNAWREKGKFDEAAACYRRAIDLQPGHPQACYNLGNLLRDQGNLAEAARYYRLAVQKLGFADAHNNLGNVLRDQGQLDEAVACYHRALELKPDFAMAQSNLGIALKDQGKLEEAIACFRRALELKSDYAVTHSNLLYTQVFCPGYDPQTLADEYRRWDQRHAAPLAKFIQPHRNDRSADRRLRIGYVSPDFRAHPVGRFVLPLLEQHDHANFEIVCYASIRVPDAITDRCRAHADVWRDMHGKSDAQVADTIREDRVDILVDLTMHMGNNRLLVFARKPAPVQVTYLAYCDTTGLGTMDYRLTDPYLDPPGQPTALYCEQSVYLPETYWCYQPAIEAPPAQALPALKAGRINFGCLNNFCKVNPLVLDAWSRLLQAVPQSRLILHAQPGSHRDRVRTFLAQQGIAAERLLFIGLLPMVEYFGVYQQIDVALDPFPYGGGTTTCDALWMGVPVVSLAGQTAVGRGGLSIASNLGLPELVAHNSAQYVRVAAELAQDLPRLAALRADLRKRMQASPLMDAPRFARNVEAAYRRMWRQWCPQ